MGFLMVAIEKGNWRINESGKTYSFNSLNNDKSVPTLSRNLKSQTPSIMTLCSMHKANIKIHLFLS